MDCCGHSDLAAPQPWVWNTPLVAVGATLAGNTGPRGSTQAARSAETAAAALGVLRNSISVDVHSHGGNTGITEGAAERRSRERDARRIAGGRLPGRRAGLAGARPQRGRGPRYGASAGTGRALPVPPRPPRLGRRTGRRSSYAPRAECGRSRSGAPGGRAGDYRRCGGSRFSRGEARTARGGASAIRRSLVGIDGIGLRRGANFSAAARSAWSRYRSRPPGRPPFWLNTTAARLGGYGGL